MAAIRVLLLGGTTEASALARHLAGDPRYAVTLSLAGVTRNPVLPDLATRIGGFGGVDGLHNWLKQEHVAAVIDATHPFATRISDNAVRAAGRAGVAALRVERPEWRPQPGDRWTRAPDAERAAACLGATPQRVLLTVGSKSLAAFINAPLHDYVVRCIDPPALLPPRAALLLARGPFTLDAERALLAERRITVLVSKNSGGEATAAKLLAARHLRLPVVLISRPSAASGGATVSTPAAALAWLAGLAPA